MRKTRGYLLFLFSLFFLLPSSMEALPQVLRVGLFYKERISSVAISSYEHSYSVYGDGKKILGLSGNSRISLHSRKGSVLVKKGDQVIGKYRTVKLERNKWGAAFRLNTIDPGYYDRVYDDELTVWSLGNRLRLINRVYLEHYISGVVLAESGKDKHLEYYKVQSIIVRTYALHNLDKFKEYGFHLCDKVDCQVYKGRNVHEPDIDKAVKETKGIVIVDSNIKLITAAYHSNSGGETVSSGDVWSYHLPYLESVEDTFSHGQPHFNWERKVPKKHWINYLDREFDYPVENDFFREYATDYCPDRRKVCFAPTSDSIYLEKIRRDLGLGSTYFTIQEQKDTIVFKGKGFGHGVGLSQEGAMRMADLGIPYNEILHYYYKNVHLVKIEALDFFRQE